MFGFGAPRRRKKSTKKVGPSGKGFTRADAKQVIAAVKHALHGEMHTIEKKVLRGLYKKKPTKRRPR